MINIPHKMIVLSHLKIQNVNMVSSPLTWGFPAISSILGFVHALERKLTETYSDLKLDGVGVICHDFSPQIYQPNPWNDASFHLTRNPLDKDGKTPALVEEGRAHIEISLIIPAFSQQHFIINDETIKIESDITDLIQTLRFAGGSFVNNESSIIKIENYPSTYDEQIKFSKKTLRKLLPGFALISREDLLIGTLKAQQLNNPDTNALDILLDYASVHHEPNTIDDNTEKTEWNIRKNPGWIVPIPIGYIGISEKYAPGTVLNARDNNYPFQFVESIYSLGQWLGPHRIKDINDIFWRYETDIENSLYRCINNPKDFLSNLTPKE